MLNIKIQSTKVNDVFIINPCVFEDDRGFFFESFNEQVFCEHIGRDIRFVQDNHSQSNQGVLRGLHYQDHPFAQAKLVRVIRGEVWDIAVDIRPYSKTYGKWIAEILSADNKKQLWIPEGFAHGFYVLSDVAELVYKANQFYSKSHEQIIHWKNNPFKIEWPITNNEQIFLSKKDSEAEPYVMNKF